MLISLAAANVAVADLASPIMEIQLYGSFPGYGNGSMFFHTYDSESNTETSVKDYLPNNLFQGAQDTGFINSGKTLKLDRNPREISLLFNGAANALFDGAANTLRFQTRLFSDNSPSTGYIVGNDLKDSRQQGLDTAASAFGWIVGNVLDSITWLHVTQVGNYYDSSYDVDLGYWNIAASDNGSWTVTLPNLSAGTFGSMQGLIFQFGDASTDPRRSAAVAAATPEPATLAIFGLGLAGLTALRRRKQ